VSKQKRKMPCHSRVFHHWRINKLLPLNATKYTCFECGYVHPTGCNLERAHIVARCDGGPDICENLVLLCHDCHVETDGRTFAEWTNTLKNKQNGLWLYQC
jgi:5-methylcytosine-specific restriction endonuclease McrA